MGILNTPCATGKSLKTPNNELPIASVLRARQNSLQELYEQSAQTTQATQN